MDYNNTLNGASKTAPNDLTEDLRDLQNLHPCRELSGTRSGASIRKSLINCKNHGLNLKVERWHALMITENRFVDVGTPATDTGKTHTFPL